MKTDEQNLVGKHAFEVAGLGLAPFRFVGLSENSIAHPDGSTQAGGTCDYCSTGIRHECHIVSSDGKRSKVGCNCIEKVGDKGLFHAYKNSPELRAHKRKLAQTKALAVHGELLALLTTQETTLRAKPHPRGFLDRATGLPLTAWDDVQWCLSNNGDSGKAAWLRVLKKA